ncbi:hypothetical protein [Liquorilactobacillus hordei]|uniref:hypothetical protein n=1 Tax=Liquorilactobacillus hordei TaxID=468911 RepID=UPI0039EBEF56
MRIVAKSYLLQYWGYNEKDETDTTLRSKDVVATEETVDQLTANSEQQFFKFIIKDGEELIIRREYIHSLTRQF